MSRMNDKVGVYREGGGVSRREVCVEGEEVSVVGRRCYECRREEVCVEGRWVSVEGR